MPVGILDTHFDKWAPEPNTGCFIWTGAASRGYGAITVGRGKDRRSARVSRLVCEEANGPPPTSKHDAAHNTQGGCVGRICVNPSHLRWATRSANMLDIQRKSERREAKLAGLWRYFSSSPCNKGHVGFRYVRNHGCIACDIERSAIQYAIKKIVRQIKE